MRLLYIVIVLAMTLLSGCATITSLEKDYVPDEVKATWPERANAVVISTDRAPEQAMSDLAMQLTFNGFPIAEKTGLSMYTRIGQIPERISVFHNQAVRILAAAVPDGTGSKVVVKAEMIKPDRGLVPVERSKSIFANSGTFEIVVRLMNGFEPYERIQLVWIEEGETIIAEQTP